MCRDELYSNKLSNIDICVNLFLNKKVSQTFLSDRFKFPSKDPINLEMYKDTRGPNQMFSDIVSIVNQKIPEGLAETWSQVVKRDISHPCYYKSGLSYLSSDMRKLQKDFEFKQKIDFKPEITMPDNLKQIKGHNKFCKQDFKNQCSYKTIKQETYDLEKFPDAKQFMLTLMKDAVNLCEILLKPELCLYFIDKITPLSFLCKQLKTLQKFKKIVSTGSVLKIKFRQKLLMIINDLLQINIEKNTKTVFISDINQEKLPFGQGIIFPKHYKNQFLQLNMLKFLVDCGSDCSILPYSIFKNLNFNDNQLQKCGNYNLKGSTGTLKNVFLGKIDLKISLKTENKSFYKSTVSFFITNPSVSLSTIILGNDWLKSTKAVISYPNDNIIVNCSLFDKYNKQQDCRLQLVQNKNNQIFLQNSNAIQKGDQQGSFLIQSFEEDYTLDQCILQNDDILFPLVDFSHLYQVFMANSSVTQIIPTHKTEVWLPFLHPVEKVLETGQAKVKLDKCVFIERDLEQKIFEVESEQVPSSSKARQQSGQLSDGQVSNREPATSQPGEEWPSYPLTTQAADVMETEISPAWEIPAVVSQNFEQKYSQNEAFAFSCQEQFRANDNLNKCTFQSENYSFESEKLSDLEKQKLRKQNLESLQSCYKSCTALDIEEQYFDPEILKQSMDSSEEDEYFESYLASEAEDVPSQSYSKIVDKFTIGRISMDTIQEQDKSKNKAISHLSKQDSTEVSEIINKFPAFWAKDKHQVGHFTGFKARITPKDGTTALQKERRLNLTHLEGVRETMEGLIKNDVFALSDQKHNEFCANLNIVPKVDDSSELRYQSKADKYLQKQGQNSGMIRPPTGWRAAFDYTTLNDVSEEIGKLSLPTISEIQTKVSNCICSSLDLKNQFYSILLEETSKPFTNFYWDNKIFLHQRLAMGLSCSPFIAQQAMYWTFSDNVLERFKNENNFQDLEFTSFSQFLDFYLDDVIIYNSLKSKNSKYNPKKLHLILLRATIFALNEAGWISSLKKCKFLTTRFTFLGQEIDSSRNYSIMQHDRIKATMKWRSPKSCAEAGSRLSVLGYFSKFAPFLRLLALPIYHMISGGEFYWKKEQEEAFSNVKFLISLNVEIYHYDPNKILLITSDSSHVSMNCSYFNFDTDTGELFLIDSQTKLFSAAEIRYSPVQKESMALSFALQKGEPYIRGNTKETLCLCDASSLQYIRRSKLYHSKQYNDAIYISSLPRLSVLYTSGRSLLLSDILTRQFQNIYLKNNLSLSQEMTKLIPPLNQLKIKELTKLNSELLTDYILSTPRQELIDVWPKRMFYKQNVHKTQIHSAHQNISNEQQLILGLLLQWNNQSILSLPVWNDIILSKGEITKSMAANILKMNNLGKIHQKLKSLNIKEETLNELLEKYHFPQNDQKSQSFLTEISKEICSCKECTDLLKKSHLNGFCLDILKNQNMIISDFISSSVPLIRNSHPDEIKVFIDHEKSLKCDSAKQIINMLFFQFIISALNKNQFQFNFKQQSKTISFLNYYISDDFYIKVSAENKLEIYNVNDIQFNPLDIQQLNLDFLLAFSGNIDQITCNLENFVPLTSPLCSGPVHGMSYYSLYNLDDVSNTVKSNTLICTIDLSLHCDAVILLKGKKDLLQERQSNLQDSSALNSLDNLTEIICKNSSYFSKLNFDNAKSKSFSMQQKQVHISTLSSFCKVENEAFPKNKKGEMHCFFNKYQKQLSQILVGQNFIKNKGIFNNAMMQSLQGDEEFYFEIISELKKKQAGSTYKGFTLKEGTLFKVKNTLQSQIFKLCLPTSLAGDILYRMHNVYSLHFSADQTLKIFTLNFFCPNQSEIIKKAINSCSICQICKPNYHRKSIGESRTYEDNLCPGAITVADILYLPRDEHQYKYVLMFIDRLTGYTSAVPLKSTESSHTAEALKQYLNFIPAPTIILTDGDGSFGGAFEKICSDNNISHRTKINRRSESQGSVEVAIRDFKNILNKIAHEKPNGRNSWSTLLPLLLNVFNARHPFNRNLSRKNLYFSPYFSNMLNILFCPSEHLSENFNKNMIKLQHQDHLSLNDTRKKALKRMHSRLGKPVKFKLQPGQICTESSTKDSPQTKDGSKALLPGCQKLFKVLEVYPGNMGALCKNLHTGQVMSHNVDNLRFLDVPDILQLHIDPTHAFSDFVGNRAKNLYGRGIEEIQDKDPLRKSTRSGRTFYTTVHNQTLPVAAEGILKKNTTYSADSNDLNFVDLAQVTATKRGLRRAKSVRNSLNTAQEEVLKFLPKKNLQLYNIKNLMKTMSSGNKLSFAPEVSCKIIDDTVILPLNFDNKQVRKSFNLCYYIKHLGETSLIETCYLSTFKSSHINNDI